MSKEKTGGPAFPFEYEDEIAQYVSHGMTLRDYFAAKAMQGFCVAGNIHSVDVDVSTKKAYLMADAMLKVRGEL
jgi:hypothetical protein